MTPDAGTPGWLPVAFRTMDGDGVDTWRTTPPPGLVQRLNREPEIVGHEAIAATAACGGLLIDVRPVTVAGCLGLRRIEQLPAWSSPQGPRCAATLIVMREDLGVEISVTCDVRYGAGAGDGITDAAQRPRRLLDRLEPSISPLWYAQSLERKATKQPRKGLAKARRAAGLYQADLAAKLGVSLWAVSQWELGIIGVDIKHYRGLADALGLCVAEVARLVEGDPAPAAYCGPGAEVWEIPVPCLPHRPCTAFTGPAGVYAHAS